MGHTKQGGFGRRDDLHFVSPHEQRRRVEQDVEAGNGGNVRCEGEVDDDGVVGSRRGTRRTGRGVDLQWRPGWMRGGRLRVRE
jgi:hypothetical protein